MNRLRTLVAGALCLGLLVTSAGGAYAETTAAWVQNHRPATLWSGPDSNAVRFGSVPTWSGFEVLGRQGERMYVRYLGNGVDREPGVAWVDVADVGPTDRPLLWLAPKTTAALWSGPDQAAALFGFAPAESLMVRIGPAEEGRAQVYFLGVGSESPPGMAWVDLKDLQASLGPPSDSPLWQVWGTWEAQVVAEAQRQAALRAEAERLAALQAQAAARPLIAPASSRPLLTPSPSSASSSTTTAKLQPITAADQERFIEQVGQLARRYRAEIGLPPSIVVAIAINETGWGRSTLSKEAHNYFGIKAHRGGGTAGAVEYQTWEVVDGKTVTITAPFRAYYSLEESVRDLGAFLRSNSRYETLLKEGGRDPQVAARELFKAGYATDPLYPEKLLNIINRHGLGKLDAT